METKSKADFINSVAGGKSVPCSQCGKENKPENKCCIFCGSKLHRQEKADTKSGPAFETGGERPAKESAKKQEKYIEPASVFADGLPSWDIVPPQVMMRR